MPTGDISIWSTSDKAAAAILRSRRYLPESIARQLDAFLTPGNLALMAGTLAVWAGSHFFGVGEVVDVALLLVGAFTIGWSITGVVRDLVAFGTGVVAARTDQDLDGAARLFASAVVTAGITAVFAILLRRSASSLQAARGSTVGEVLTIRRPGLVPVEPEPAGTGLFRTPTVTGNPGMAAGEGATTVRRRRILDGRNGYGPGTGSPARTGSFVSVAAAVRFSHVPGTSRDVSVQPLGHHAISRGDARETFAQLRVNGIQTLLTGIRFPVVNGHMTLQQLACEGAEIGKITMGTQQFSVQFVAGPPSGGP